jgi:hypothetical protein
MPSDKFFVSDEAGIEPLAVPIDKVKGITGESRSKVYELIGDGTYEAVKAGSRTLVLYESIKRRIAALPRAQIKTQPPRRHPKANQVK